MCTPSAGNRADFLFIIQPWGGSVTMGPQSGPGSEGSKGSKGSKEKVLKMDGPSAQGFLSLTGPLAPRVVDCRWRGNKYIVSVTGFAFVPLWLLVISSDGKRRHESLLHGARESRNLPQEGCLSIGQPTKRKASLYFFFPLEGKCRGAAKGCTMVSILMMLPLVPNGPTSADL